MGRRSPSGRGARAHPGRGCPPPRTAPRRARRCRARIEIGVLQHGVHGPADRGAVAAALPGRQVEVDGLLVEAPASAGTPRSSSPATSRARARPVALVADRRRPRPQRPRRARRATRRHRPRAARAPVRRRRGSGTAASSSTVAPWASAPPAARTWALGARVEVTGALQRLAVHGHDEVVHRPRAGDVQQSPALARRPSARRAGRYVLEQLVALLGERPGRARPHDGRAVLPAHLGGHAGEHGDRELQALGRVHGHHPHGVVVALGQDRVAGAGPRWPGTCAQREVAAHAAAAGLRPRPRLVDDVAHPPPARRGRRARRERSRARAARRRCDRGGRRASPGRRPGRSTRCGRCRAATAWSAEALGRAGEQVAAAAGLRATSSSSTSLQPYSGERRAATSARPSVGSAAARRVSSRSRISGARYTTVAFSARYGSSRAARAPSSIGQRRARRQQHGDVARAARSQSAVAVAHRPALAQGGGDGRGDGGGLPLGAARRRRRRRGRAPSARARGPLPWSRRPRPAGVERAVRRLDVRLGTR